MFIILYEKLFSFLRYLHFCLDFFSYEEKNRLHIKVKLNSKIYDVTDWTANNYNIHIAQHLKK